MQVADVSVVVPMFNAVSKLGACVESLILADDHLKAAALTMEVVFVDDSSTDKTLDTLRKVVTHRSRWHLHSTERNSGSPSKPRNIGLKAATGRYVFFLDGDDEINAEGLLRALTSADENLHDLVRGPVLVHYLGEDRRVTVDKLAPPDNASAAHMMEIIARGQSLNCSALWRRQFLVDHSLEFDTSTRMGEDLVFTSAAMSQAESIGYVDRPLFHYRRQPGGGGSSMHHFGGRELRELVGSWQAVEDHFEKRGLSYLDLHGDRTINYAIRLVIRYYMADEIGDSDVELFAAFFVQNREALRRLAFADPHVRDFVGELSTKGSVAFWDAVKPRLLIAGHDLKFILPAVPHLRRWFTVRVDEWPSEIMHNEKQSQELLDWADFVWVEWLTAASVWFAQRIRRTQNLVVRAHRYELGRSYGDIIARNNVDAFITIAPHCYEDLIERFALDRSKVHFLPNFYMVDEYRRADPSDDARLYRLALIGAVPQRKGLLKGLELLANLHRVDSRYSLSILGRRPDEIPWVSGDPHEQEYFAACEEFIREQQLEDAVQWVGWSNTYEDVCQYGFVLSTSEHEGSHVGPGEAYCAGNQGIFLRWRGAEFVYPEDFVFDSIDEMTLHVLSMRDIEAFNETSARAREFMRESYHIDVFVDRVRALMRSVG